MLGCKGTSTQSVSFITASSRLPCRPAGVSSTACVVPPAAAHDVARQDVPGRDARQPCRPQRQPAPRRLLAVDVAEHHGVAPPGARASPRDWSRACSCRPRPSGWRPRSPACAPPRRCFAGAGNGARAAGHHELPESWLTSRPAAHPHMQASRVNCAPRARDRRLATERVELRDLYALYPDYLVDVDAEQAAPAQARLVVWMHLVHWYGMPPLLCAVDRRRARFGWAYGPGEALRSTARTSGSSPRPAVRRIRIARQLQPLLLRRLPAPYEQTAMLCGMRFVPPLVLHGAHRVDDDEPGPTWRS